MNYFAVNLKVLRKYKQLSQAKLAEELELTRSTLSAYENGTAEPNFTALIRIANYFKIGLDRFLKQNISSLTEFELRKIEMGYDQDIEGKHLRILATTVNDDNEEQIEVVSHQAKAGYANGYADPEYISDLPRIQLQSILNTRKHRVFPISGDSMPPVSDGSYVVAEYLEDWTSIKPNTPCIVITQDDGIVFKLVTSNIETEGSLMLVSTNPLYAPYSIPANQVLEVWKFKQYLSDSFQQNTSETDISIILSEIRKDIHELKNKS